MILTRIPLLENGNGEMVYWGLGTDLIMAPRRGDFQNRPGDEWHHEADNGNRDKSKATDERK